MKNKNKETNKFYKLCKNITKKLITNTISFSTSDKLLKGFILLRKTVFLKNNGQHYEIKLKFNHNTVLTLNYFNYCYTIKDINLYEIENKSNNDIFCRYYDLSLTVLDKTVSLRTYDKDIYISLVSNVLYTLLTKDLSFVLLEINSYKTLIELLSLFTSIP